MYTQALNSGGGVAQRLNYPFSFLPPPVGGEPAPAALPPVGGVKVFLKLFRFLLS